MTRSFFLHSAAASALLFLAGCEDAGTGNAQTEANLKVDFIAAADALAAKTGGPGEKDILPGADDPAVKAFEVQSGKALAAIGTEALPIEGFTSFEELCGKSANIVAAFAMAGTKGTAGAAQQQKMEQNIERHFDAVFTPLLFSAQCNAAHMSFLEGELDAADPTKTDAVKQVQAGMLGQVSGLMEMAGDSTTEAARREQILNLLANNASKFAIGLSAAQRQQVTAQAQKLSPVLPENLRAKLATFRSELERAPCGKICSVA